MSRPSGGLRKRTIQGVTVWTRPCDWGVPTASAAAAATPVLEFVATWVAGLGYVTLDELAEHCGLTVTAAHDLARWCGLAGRGRVRMLARATAAEHVEVALEALAQG